MIIFLFILGFKSYYVVWKLARPRKKK